MDGENDNDDIVRGFEHETPLEQLVQGKFSSHVRMMHEFFASGEYVTEKGDANTNIINNAEAKSYNIPDDVLPEFFRRLEDCRLHRRTMNYAERQETANRVYSGIMIDLDIFQRQRARVVEPRHLQRIIGRIASILRETLAFEIDEQTFDFHVFVISKPEIRAASEGVFKDGYHLLIPEVRVCRSYKKWLITEINRREVFQKVFADIAADLVDVSTILDKGSAYVPVNFVGSAKAGSSAYPLTSAYSVNIELEDSSMMNVAPIQDIDALVNGVSPDGDRINLVYELSLSFYFIELGDEATWLVKREFDYVDAIQDKVQHFAERRAHNIIDEEEIEDIDNDVDILTLGNAEANYIKRLLGLLDISYATEYDKWFKVICAIANTSPRYKPLAVWFSQRNPGAWSADGLERAWNEASHRRPDVELLTKRSIMYWAHECSPERFVEIDRENYNNILTRAVYSNKGKIEHADAAKVVYAMVGDKFVCDVPRGDKTGKERVWYEFVLPGQKHIPGEVFKWRREDDPDILHNFIADQLPKIYDDQLARLEERKAEAADIAEQKFWTSVIKSLEDSKVKLGNDLYQTKVVKQCQRRFRVRGFSDELDSHPMTLGVGNGVLLLGQRPRLIQSFHEYKISAFTKVCYRPYNPNDPHVVELLKIVEDIIPEEDAREWIMFNLSTFLDKNEVSGLMLQIRGGGRNGKTWILKMTHETLGDLFVCSFRPELLVGPNEKANEANSAKMQLMGKTGGYCDEFKATDVFNSTRVKTIVNPNRQGGRELYGRETNFKNTANIVLATNHEIISMDTDYGYWRRNLYYEAKVKFTEKPDPANPFEKKVNDKIMDAYPADPYYQEAWLSILVHYHARLYSEYNGNIKRVPKPTIDRETELYRDRQDTLNRFINQMVVRSPNADAIVLEKLATAYIDWYNRYVQQMKFKADTVKSLIEASKLHSSIVTMMNNTKMLTGHRLLDSLDDPLDEGESWLNNARPLEELPPGAEDDVSDAGGDVNSDSNASGNASIADDDSADNVGEDIAGVYDSADSEISDDEETASICSNDLEEYVDEDFETPEMVQKAAQERVRASRLKSSDIVALAERNTPTRMQVNKQKQLLEKRARIEASGAAKKYKDLPVHKVPAAPFKRAGF